MKEIFPEEPLLRAQIALIKLRRLSFDLGYAEELQQEILNEIGNFNLNIGMPYHEFYSIHHDARAYIKKLESSLENKQIMLNTEIDRINGLSRQNAQHKITIKRCIEELKRIDHILNYCLK